MKTLTKKESDKRSIQSAFRVGKYIIYQVPLNIVLSSIGLSDELEEIIQGRKSYHRDYESALEVLLVRMVEDNMARGTVTALKELRDSIREAKEEILKEVRLQKEKLK